LLYRDQVAATRMRRRVTPELEAKGKRAEDWRGEKGGCRWQGKACRRLAEVRGSGEVEVAFRRSVVVRGGERRQSDGRGREVEAAVRWSGLAEVRGQGLAEVRGGVEEAFRRSGSGRRM
jgi:hypothetical protein